MEDDGSFRAFRLFHKGKKVAGIVPKRIQKTYHETDDDYYTGLARCWVRKVKEDGKEFYVVFNGYGMEISKFATILSSYLGLEMKEVRSFNRDDVQEFLFVNSSRAMLVGKPEVIKDLKEYDFKFYPKVEREEYDKGNAIGVGGIRLANHENDFDDDYDIGVEDDEDYWED